MPQVSRKPLPKAVENKIFSIFFASLARLSNPSDIEAFLFDFLGPVERTMLAKRLAIAILLAKGYSYDAIKSVLHVSQETIARVNISLNYGGKGYEKVVQQILRSEKINKLFEASEDILIKMVPYSSTKRTLIKYQKTRKPRTPLG